MSGIDVTAYRARVRVILRKADLETITAKAVRLQIQDENDVDLSAPDVRKRFDELVMDVLQEINPDPDVKDEVKREPEMGVAQVKKPKAAKPATPALVFNLSGRRYPLIGPTRRPKAQPAPPPVSAPSSVGGPGRKKGVKSEEYIQDSDTDGEPRGNRQMTDEEYARMLQDEENSRSRGTKRKAAAAPPKKAPAKRRAGTGGAFSKPWAMSEQLSAVCGGAKELPRGQVVKAIWTYIKEHDLQDPSNKKRILCDDALQAVFGKKKVDAFGMMKLLEGHLWKTEDAGERVVDSDDEDDSDEGDDDSGDDSDAPPKKEKKSRASSSKSKAAAGEKGTKKASGGGWNAPLLLSPPLRTVIEEAMEEHPVNSLGRPIVVKQIWVYIRKHDLQDPSDRRNIRCDQKLRPIFANKAVVGMFALNKHLKGSLVAGCLVNSLCSHPFLADHLRPLPSGLDPKSTKWEDVYDDVQVAKESDSSSSSDEEEKEEEEEDEAATQVAGTAEEKEAGGEADREDGMDDS